MRPELNKLVEKAMADTSYLQRLLANPAEAAREVGVELTAEELEQIKPLSVTDANSLLAAQKKAGC